VYVKQEKWDEVKQNLKSFQDLIEIFNVVDKEMAL
jgi:type III restriction enzyme